MNKAGRGGGEKPQGQCLWAAEQPAMVHTGRFCDRRGAWGLLAPHLVFGDEVPWRPEYIFARGAGYCVHVVNQTTGQDAAFLLTLGRKPPALDLIAYYGQMG